MYTPKITIFRDARIIDIAKYGATISYISKETGIPFTSVRNKVYEFENIGVIKTRKRGKKVFVSVPNPNHIIVKSMTEMAKWITDNIWNIDVFIARRFEKNNIDYAFVGITKIKYTHHELRNMIQIAVKKEHFDKAKKLIKSIFSEIDIAVTEDPRETIGKAMSVIYVKCFPVKVVKYKKYDEILYDSNEVVRVRIADNNTEKEAMRYASIEDKMFMPI